MFPRHRPAGLFKRSPVSDGVPQGESGYRSGSRILRPQPGRGLVGSLTDLDFYKGRCYGSKTSPVTRSRLPFSRGPTPLDPSRRFGHQRGSPPLVATVFRLQALRQPPSWKDIRSDAFIKTCPGPADGICVERDRMNKIGLSAAGLHDQAEASVPSSGKKRTTAGGLRVSSRGLDFTKDDEKHSSSQPFQRWQNRFGVSLLKPSNRPNRKPARRGQNYQYLNCTAAHPEEMYERAEFRQRNSPADPSWQRLHHRRLHCNTVCRSGGRKKRMLLPHIHRANARGDRHRVTPASRIHSGCCARCPAPLRW